MAREMKDSGVAWIGEIPTEWDVKRMRHILCSNDGGIWGDDPLNDGTDKIVLRSTEQTVDGQWSIINPATRSLTAVDYSKYRISPGDLLITKSSGSGSHIGKTTIADSTFSVGEYYYSNFIQRIRISNSNPTFVWYLLNSPITREQFVYLQNSTSGIGNINADMIQNIYVPIPPIIEQEKIFTFLNRKCAELDIVLEKTRTSIEEYKKLKQAIITQAVTKGVRGDRPMKESGIEWVPMIPADWSSFRGKHLFYETNERSETGSEELLTVSHKTGITPRSQKNVNMFMSESLVGYKICREGDIAANTMWMWQGAIGVSAYHGVISPSYNTYHQRKGAFDPQYLDYLLRIQPLVEQYNVCSTGITASRLRLYPEQFLSIKFVVPPIEEQQEIVKFLHGRVDEMDTIIQKKEQFLTELETYKKSLIYEYVTGKKVV